MKAHILRNQRKLERSYPGTMAKAPAKHKLDILRNQRKLERKAPAKVEADTASLKVIWRNEGIDVAMTICKRLGFKRYDAWKLIESWMFPK